MRSPKRHLLTLCLLLACLTPHARAQHGGHGDHAAGTSAPSTADGQSHQQSAAHYADTTTPNPADPALPEGMTLDQVLDIAAEPPPSDYPPAFMDDTLYLFFLAEKLEYRHTLDDTPDYLLLEFQGWFGNDNHKLWWKHESEWTFDGPDGGESETDLLYSRLIAPFWSLQGGIRYANEWAGDEYEDTWSGVIALQGMAPYMFEMDNSLLISEHGDISLEIEAEYDLRITQRLVLQPHAELAVYAQDIPEHNIGAGLSDLSVDIRLRYEIKREFAPYIGIGYHTLVGETHNRAAAAGDDTEQVYVLAGLRFAF